MNRDIIWIKHMVLKWTFIWLLLCLIHSSRRTNLLIYRFELNKCRIWISTNILLEPLSNRTSENQFSSILNKELIVYFFSLILSLKSYLTLRTANFELNWLFLDGALVLVDKLRLAKLRFNQNWYLLKLKLFNFHRLFSVLAFKLTNLHILFGANMFLAHQLSIKT